jgi:hypothetical protein
MDCCQGVIVTISAAGLLSRSDLCSLRDTCHSENEPLSKNDHFSLTELADLYQEVAIIESAREQISLKKDHCSLDEGMISVKSRFIVV